LRHPPREKPAPGTKAAEDPRRCSLCSHSAVLAVPYSGNRLCRSHFLEFFERRVKQEIRAQGPFTAGDVVAVGVSGGKDSITALRLLHEVLGARRDLRMAAITVDEGIGGYREPGLRIAAETARELGVQHVTIAYKDLVGKTLDEALAEPLEHAPTACGICGPLRRRALNEAARSLGATRLATGHNLDDMAQTVLLNVLRGDVEGVARMAPHPMPARPGLVPRVVPLRSVPEREVALYAHLRGFRYDAGECPHSSESERGRIRDILLDLEERSPGTRHRLLRVRDRIARWDGGRDGD
jgi:tRNA(Ile)-lysidine synthase TilS/MesJ